MTKNRKTENILDTLGVIKIKTLFFSELYAFAMQSTLRTNIILSVASLIMTLLPAFLDAGSLC